MAKEVLELEVKSDIGKTTKEADKLAKSIDKSTANTKELRTASNIGTVGFTKLKNAVTMVGTALKALGIGLMIAAFATLKQLFEQNQKVLDFFNTSFKAASILFRDLFTYLENNIGSYVTYMQEMFEDPVPMIETLALSIRDKFIQSLISLNTFIVQVSKSLLAFTQMRFKDAVVEMDLAALALLDTFLGVDGAAKKIKTQFTSGADKLKKYTTTVWDTAAGMTELEKRALLAEVQFAKLNAENLREAEIQRQIRDDVSKTFAVRIEANKKLGEILAKQSADQEVQLQIQLDAALAAKSLNDTTETKIALGLAEVAMLELQETITGQKSEQLTNQIALEEELRVGKEQSLAEGSSGLERELAELENAYEEKKRLAIKSGVETTDITKQFEKEQADIIKASAKELEDAKIELAKNGISVIQGIMDVQSQEIENQYNNEIRLAEGNEDALEGIEEKFAGKRREQAAKFQTMKIGMAIIDTYQGATAAYANALTIPGAGLALAPIAAGLAVAAGLANIALIEKQPLGGGGGGGGGSSSAATAPSTPAPQMMSGAFDISGGVAPEATKAFVVTDEMSSSQAQLANIRRRATI